MQYTIINYSFAGDVCVLILCITLFVCLLKSFVIISDRVKTLSISLGIISLISLINILLHILILNNNINCLIIVAVTIFLQFLYSCILHTFTLQILNISNIEEKAKKKLLRCIITINVFALIIGTVLKIVSINSQNNCVFIASFYPYIFAFCLTVTIILSILFKCKESIIKPLRYALLIVVTICLVINFLSITNLNISYINISLLLPSITIMYMTLSNPYNINTGALAGPLFREYLSKDNKKHTFFCIKFYEFERMNMPKELTNLLRTFWMNYFKNVDIFNAAYGVFVISIKEENIDDKQNIVKAAEYLSKELSVFDFSHKLVVFNDDTVDINPNSFYGIMNHLFDKTNINNTKICDDNIYDELSRMIIITDELITIAHQHDLNNEHVLVYCQPIKNVKLNTYNTAEALMRIKSDKLGFIEPNEFIPILEEMNLIHAYSMIMLNKLCQFLNTPENEFVSRISINFSISELKEPGFIDDFINIVHSNGTPYHKIGIEFTESTNNVEFEKIRKTVETLKSLGCIVYLDDFGTGYSNFDRLIGLDMNVVKFDRSLLVLAETEDKTRRLLNSFAGIFSDLGYEVLYEGIETDAQEDLCLLSNADYLQGYKYSKPIPIEELYNFTNK